MPPPRAGPGKDTMILVYKVYYDGFKNVDLGGSAAQSVVLMVDRHRPDGHPVPLRREEGALLHGRAQPHPATSLSHLVLVLGLLIVVVFPLYLAFVASTHTAQDILQVPMPLLPGSNLVETYTARAVRRRDRRRLHRSGGAA